MRWTSMLAGLVVVVITIAGVGLAMRQSPVTPAESGGDSAGEVEVDLHPGEDSEPDKDAGMVKSNPFTPSTGGPQPKAVVDNPEYNFDRLSFGATGHHDFVIRNEGAETLKLAKGTSTCQCTQFTLEATEIPPGGSAKVHLSWEPRFVTQEFEQSAHIWTNDPEHDEIVLTVAGAVVTLINRIPEGTWNVGMISEGQPTTMSGIIASSLVESFNIESVTTSSDNLQITYEPLNAEELQRANARCGYSIKCTVTPDMPVGPFREQFDMSLSLEEAPKVSFTVQGSRIGPFQVIGPGWIQERHTLGLGRFKATEGKKSKVSLFVAVPDDFDFKFDPPQVTPPIVNVSLEPDAKFSGGGGKRKFFVILEVPPGITPGRWSDDTSVTVTLTSNHPTVSQAVFKVDLQAD